MDFCGNTTKDKVQWEHFILAKKEILEIHVILHRDDRRDACGN